MGVVKKRDSCLSIRPKLIVWDFDLTVLSIHSWAAGIRQKDVADRTLYDDVADLAFFRHFVQRALEQGFAVAIASFGQYEVIQAYMDRIVGRGVFNRENIATPSKFGSKDGRALRGGKVPMLKSLACKMLRASPQELSLRKSDIIFFDDSWDNVCGAIENGFIHSVLVDCRGFCEQLWNEVKCPLGMDNFCDASKLDDSLA
ncbi:hypothetical protein MICPUN_55064 [Micromonas commoda]|uniref:FCP1 homology domain-containing protein n=1 Tax=Micromonas commoda (strain RCC299 / NOUM17 / CCMP2709) TaxID=296587 RepID=C1FDL1_MICCC|nr:hypothetical protein MICPUN_55064 [Micromonas commoda]ACO68405.1 hypothetical protein MICPUN_55064 [Micromonas commoda]|eukprot:XP_002507147.1 hypothetical protein MICPUN_55064 [Micromonas commoda]